MSVEPGFGGQKFINTTLSKVDDLVSIRSHNHQSFLIEVDGGINNINIKNLNCDIAVIGSYITNYDDYQVAIDTLKN